MKRFFITLLFLGIFPLESDASDKLLSCSEVLSEPLSYEAIVKQIRENKGGRVHPLGFYFADINYGNKKLRLHVYPQTFPFDKQDPNLFPAHSHDWTLNSLVISGTLENRIYTWKPKLNGKYAKYLAHRKEINGIKFSYLTITTEYGELMEAARSSFNAGRSYNMEPSIYHQVYPQTELVVTLVHGPRDLDQSIKPDSIGEKEIAEKYTPIFYRTQNSELITELMVEQLSMSQDSIGWKSLQDWLNSLDVIK